ncbi:MAG: ABC transporter substrate-binding protein [Candidatus Dormibacteria bacterium]
MRRGLSRLATNRRLMVLAAGILTLSLILGVGAGHLFPPHSRIGAFIVSPRSRPTVLATVGPMEASSVPALPAPQVASTPASSGVVGAEVVIGSIFDITGPVSALGPRDALRALLARTNAAGGVLGRHLRLLECDAAYDPGAAARCGEQMIRARVLAVVGSVAPLAEDEVARSLAQAGIPIIGGSGTPAEFGNALSFPVAPDVLLYGDALAARAAELGMHHPAIIYNGDAGWSQDFLARLLGSLHSRGLTETHVEKVPAPEKSWALPVFTAARQGDGPAGCPGGPTKPCPDGLIAAVDPAGYVGMFAKMDEQGWHPALLALGLDQGGLQGPYGDQLAGAQSLLPAETLFASPPGSELQAFQSAVGSPALSEMDSRAQLTWSAGKLLIEAMVRIGSAPSRASLLRALGETRFSPGWQLPLDYGPTGRAAKGCFMAARHGPRASAGGSWQDWGGWRCY